MNISWEDKLHFWVSIAGGRLPAGTTYEQARDYWYGRGKYRDIYDAVASIPYDRTFARTVRGIGDNPNKAQIVDGGKRYVAKQLRLLNVTAQAEFDEWHRGAVAELIGIFTEGGQRLHVGQGQKWINMALKHLWLADEELVGNLVRFCHVPLDNYLYDALTSVGVPREFKGIEMPFGGVKGPWSKMDDYDAYLRFQAEFRKRCSGAPLASEFALWQKRKDVA